MFSVWIKTKNNYLGELGLGFAFACTQYSQILLAMVFPIDSKTERYSDLKGKTDQAY